MESSGIALTIVMNPRVTRRLRGESGIMQAGGQFIDDSL